MSSGAATTGGASARVLAATAASTTVEEVLDRMSDGFIAYDRDWRIVHLNARAEGVFGRKAELLGKRMGDAFPEVVGSRLEAELRGAAAAGLPREAELLGPTTRRWQLVKVFPSPQGVSVYFTDVTGRRTTESALRESEARYRAVFENALDGILLTAPSGEILSANPVACAVFGRSEAELCAVGRTGVIDLNDPRAVTFLEERQRTGRARGELTVIRKDGTRVPVEVASAVFEDDSHRLRTAMTVEDLTEKKRAERALRVLAQTASQIAASLDVDEVLKGLAGLVVAELADICTVDLLEDGVLRRIAGEHRDRDQLPRVFAVRPSAPLRASADRGVERVLRTGAPEFVPVVTDAWLQAAATSSSALDLARGLRLSSALMVPLKLRAQTIGVLSMASIEGGKRLEARDLDLAQELAGHAATAVERAQLYAASVSAARLRDEVLGVVSHDLRNPLGAILLSATALARETESPHLATIKRNVMRADRLIEDLLVTAMVDAGKLTLDRKAEPLDAVVDDVAVIHRALAEAKGVTLTVAVSAPSGEVFVDRHRLIQALSNLVDNAVKFTPKGGRVALEAAREGGELRLRVADTGAGIPPEQVPHVFDRFWQGAHARRAGAGLGLAIAKGVIEAHGGTISIETVLGRGTTFLMRLPAAAVPVSAA